MTTQLNGIKLGNNYEVFIQSLGEENDLEGTSSLEEVELDKAL